MQENTLSDSIQNTFTNLGVIAALNDKGISDAIKYASPALIPAGVASLASTAGKNLGITIPLMVALLAGTYYAGEKVINEDKESLEKDKADILTYRAGSGDLVRMMKNKGYTDDQIQAALDGDPIEKNVNE